jgi:hypothetical protein
LAKKLEFFSKPNVMIKILHILALFWVKTPTFLPNFSAKIFKKSYKIGPRLGELSSNWHLFTLWKFQK